MLKSIHRLSTKQFMEVMEKGRIHTSPLFVVRVLQGLPSRSRSTLTEPRAQTSQTGGISAVAPKKVAPTAVLRNKTRRRIYEAAAPLRSSILSGNSMIIFAKKEAVQADLKEMAADLKNLFLKAKISV